MRHCSITVRNRFRSIQPYERSSNKNKVQRVHMARCKSRRYNSISRPCHYRDRILDRSTPFPALCFCCYLPNRRIQSKALCTFGQIHLSLCKTLVSWECTMSGKIIIQRFQKKNNKGTIIKTRGYLTSI